MTSIATLHDYNFDGIFAETNNRTFSYEAATNRLIQVNDTLQPPSEMFQYNNPGDVIRYGNTVYDWDATGMMTQLKLDTGSNTNGFRYLYTADDERVAVRKWSGTQADTRYYLRDLSNQVLREYLYLGTTKTWVRDYTYQNGLMLTVEQPITVEQPSPTLWPILDQIGTPVTYQDVNHAGNQFTAFLFAFGEDQPNKNPALIGSPKRFTGHERDQNLSFQSFKDDLDYMHARFYAPHLGRFLSVDPVIDFRRNLPEPQNWNRYSYAANNPVNRIDPDGRAWDWIPDAIGLAADVYQFVREPSWANAGVVAADVVLGAVPFVPSPGTIRLAAKADDLVDLARGLNKSADAANSGRRLLPFRDPDRIEGINQTLDRIDAGVKKYGEDGTPFKNREGALPRKPSGYYKEYTVDTPGATNRGARRIVRGQNGETYYTDNHYKQFVEIDPKRH